MAGNNKNSKNGERSEFILPDQGREEDRLVSRDGH